MLPLFRRTIKQLSDSVQELINVIHVAPNSHVVDYINHSISEWPVPVLLIPGGSLCTKYDSFSVRILSPFPYHVTLHVCHTKFQILLFWMLMLIKSIMILVVK